MNRFKENNEELLRLIDEWVPKLSEVSEDVRANNRNSQNRSLKQILGHMVDSASNNTHRIIHLQYQTSPFLFPDYASNGNNDRWIAIQNYQNENWEDLIQLWKYSHLHLIHIINNVNMEKINHEWISALNETITLQEMIIDFLRHFKLHLSEMDFLIYSVKY